MTAPQEIVERALAASASRGCVVLVRSQSITNLRWARTNLTTNGETIAQSVSVVALVDVEGGVAAGSVSVNAPKLEDIEAIVRRAEVRAAASGAAEDAADLVTGIEQSRDWADAPVIATSDAFARLAPQLGEIFAAARADDIEHFGYAEQAMTTTYLATSGGVRLRHVTPEARLELTAKSHGRTRSTWVGLGRPSFDEMDLAAVDADLRQALLWQGTRIDVPAGRHPAVLAPSSVADLLVYLYWDSVGRDAHDGSSVWSRSGGGTRVGELVVDPRATLSSDASYAGLECVPFIETSTSSGYASVFDNGIATPHVDWIKDGVLRGLMTSRHTARMADLEFNPPVENLKLEVAGGVGTLHDLASRTQDGLMVTCTWYNRTVDPQTALITGLTRDGVYVVRGGEVIGAATNFRFNESPVDMLGRIEDAGVPERTMGREMADYFPRTAMPALLVRDFNFSTVSQAS